MCWASASSRSLHNSLPYWALLLYSCMCMQQLLLDLGPGNHGGQALSNHRPMLPPYMLSGGERIELQEGEAPPPQTVLAAAAAAVANAGSTAATAAVGLGGLQGGSVGGVLAPYVLLLLSMVPWVLVLLLVRALPPSKAYALVWSEPTGVAIMVRGAGWVYTTVGVRLCVYVPACLCVFCVCKFSHASNSAHNIGFSLFSLLAPHVNLSMITYNKAYEQVTRYYQAPCILFRYYQAPCILFLCLPCRSGMQLCGQSWPQGCYCSNQTVPPPSG